MFAIFFRKIYFLEYGGVQDNSPREVPPEENKSADRPEISETDARWEFPEEEKYEQREH